MLQNKISKVKKRDGQIVDFDQTRIQDAIFKALTATGQGDGKRARKLSDKVIQILNRRFKKDEIPHVEQIQDIVEEVLILEDLVETAKAYILYREQRRRIREAVKFSEEAVDRIDQYIEKVDWEVQENANMAFSLQGLNHYSTSYIIKKYWLNKIYPKEIREANESGDFHLHNLDTLGPYCAGWDLYDLLLKGFGGVAGKIEGKPSKHFHSALGQVVNFMYTLQGEAAGAIAFSNFDTLLAPFIHYDNLNYQQVKQALQEFLFSMAIPTRVGFQCVSEDTEILTSQGWKGYEEIKPGDEIKTLNLETKEIENKKVKFVFKKYYKGEMYRLRNRIQDQLISPGHRVVRRKFYSNKYVLEPIEEITKLKSPFIVPIAGRNSNPEANVSDEQIKLMAWIISEGTVERPGKYRCCYRVSIYQSKIKNRENYDEIINLLNHFKLKYVNHPATSLGEEVQQIRLNAEDSRKIHQWFGTRENVHFIPEYLLNLSQRQSRLFLETFLKGDGTKEWKIATSDLGLLNDLQTIIVNAGYGFTVLKRKPTTTGNKSIYILRIIPHPETYIPKIEKVNYQGIIWCPHTENGTIIARRKGKVFITGNCPFTNITLDLKPSPVFAKLPVIIGGKPQKETYQEFEEEMKIFNKALYEVWLEGDKNQRSFSFPIPTINITKDFPWQEPAFDGIFEASAKYGVNYFANYIQSDMKPEDVRSMCLDGNEKILIRNSKKVKRASIKEIVENYKEKDFDKEGWTECKKEGSLEALSLNPKTLTLEWSPVKRFLKILDEKGVEIVTRDGKKAIFSLKHPMAIYTPQGLQMKFAKEIKVGEKILTAKSLKKLEKIGNLENELKKEKIFPVSIISVKQKNYKKPKEFYDIELEKNHLFVHSLGQISFNCCRLKLDLRDLYNRGGGGLFGSGSKTGSIGVVTINLPRIGYLSKTKKEFFERLGKIMDLAKESLEIKRKVIENFIEKGLYPYSKFYLQDIKKMRGAYYGNHFSTIGLVGMNEALLNFIGENIGSKKGRKFALEVLDFMRERLVKYQKETENIYNLEATPAESSLAPNEKVLISQSDPKLIEIGPLIDKYLEKNKEKVQIIGNSEVLPLSNKEMFTYGFSRKDQKIKKYPVTALIRHPGDSLYEIITNSGRRVKVTKYHSVFTLGKDGVPREIKVEDLKKGQVIAIPKKIKMENQYFEFNLIEKFKKDLENRDKLYLKTTSNLIEKLILDERVRKWAENYYAFNWKNVKCSWKKRKVIPLKMIYDLNINLDRKILENSMFFYRKSTNTVKIKSLIKVNRNLGFLIGIILAEGWIGKDKIEIANTEEKIIKEIASKVKKVFGSDSYYLSLKREKRGYKPLFVLTLGKIITLFFKDILKIKGKSNKKLLPYFVYFASNNFVAGLLKGFAIGDGYWYSNDKKSDYTFRLYTNSKELMEGLNILLLKLGILAKIRIDRKEKHNPLWKRNYILSISGIENLKRFFKLVFGQEFRAKLMNSGKDIIPAISKPLKLLMKKFNINTKELRKLKIHKDSFNKNVRAKEITRHYLKEILEKLEKKVKDPLLKNLRILINGDLYWDPIKSIKKIKTQKYVYDFQVNVEGNLVENFLGGEGLVCLHNTAYRLAQKDKEKYPDIITAGTKEVPFYTNSSHLPVNYTDDIFEALKLQDELQCRYTGGCIEKGNKVLTDKGLIKIEEIVANFQNLKPIRVLSYNPEKGISEWDEIVEAVSIDVKKYNKIRVKGERNLDIVTSDWHPFFVLEKFKPNPACPICDKEVKNIKAFATHIRWNLECKEKYKIFPKYQVVEKRADELKIGDYILQNSSNLYPEKEGELDNDLMWLIGFFIDDGYICKFIDNRGGNNLLKYKVCFNSQSQPALEKAAKILNKYFNCNVKVIKNDKRSDSLREVVTSKKAVSEFFFKYGFWSGKKVYNIYVPQKVKENLTKKNLYSFLSGLIDSDGTLGKRNGEFEYQTVSSKLADDLLEILTKAGIMVSKNLKKTKRENEVDIWRLRVPQYELTKLKEKLTITVNPERIKNELSNRKKRYLPVVRVKEVSKVKVKDNQFYDLMTKKNHNYLAGKNCLVFIHNTVLHLFLGERVSDPQTAKMLVKKIFENFHLPYLTLTPTFSICPVHAYLAGEHFYCPKCTIKQPCEVYSRIVGYLRPVQQWNPGKKEEFRWRREFRSYQKEKITNLPKEKIPSKK